jgi:hypothetical protein
MDGERRIEKSGWRELERGGWREIDEERFFQL